MDVEKAALRRWAAGLRPASDEESLKVAATAAEVVQRNEWSTVLTFLAMPGEVNLEDLHSRPGIRFLVTRTPRTGGLTVHDLSSELEVHPLGYRQPAPDATEVSSRTLEAVLVPGVLFDRRGGRLGHGKGYYDRLLGSMRPRPYLIGVTLERRVVPQIPVDGDDIRMDALITEQGFTEVSSF
jgi:5-formyltetrahydrofolate cyclo-ligase